MRVISKKTLIQFWKKHPETEQQLKAWYDEAIKEIWKSPRDIKKITLQPVY